jgi:hypothetical protein
LHVGTLAASVWSGTVRSAPHRDMAAKRIEQLRGYEVEIEEKLHAPMLGEPDAEEIARIKAQWRDLVLAQGEATAPAGWIAWGAAAISLT